MQIIAIILLIKVKINQLDKDIKSNKYEDIRKRFAIVIECELDIILGELFMSHSKLNKRGSSLYLDKWNPSSKKYINVCNICGCQGYSPVILDANFYNKAPNVHSEKRAIYNELTKILNPLALDELGRCEVCAKIQDEQ